MACLAVVLVMVMAVSAIAAPAPSPSQVRADLQDILSRPEYNRTFGPNPMNKFWTWVWERFQDFQRFISRLFALGHGTAGRIASFVFACLAIGGFLALLVYVALRLAGLSRRAGEYEPDLDTESYGLPSARPLIAKAAALAESGDFRGAFRCAYLASISYLDETGALRFERSRTNWEYLRELDRGGHTSARQHLSPLTLDFDRKFYGREECSRQDYERARAAFDAISAPEAA